MSRAVSFTFGSYTIDTARSVIRFTYHVEFANGKTKTYTERLILNNIPVEAWEKVPPAVLERTLQALLLMLGINYWTVFPTSTMRIEGFTLTREQAEFWNKLYLHGLGEFFYLMKMDFRGLINFPYGDAAPAPTATPVTLPARSLVLNGAGKDSILSAEMLKAAGTPFDLFAFGPSIAHDRVAAVVGAKTIQATRMRDARSTLAALVRNVSGAYPSVCTLAFVSILLAELLGYDTIVFSNERSADMGNLEYLGLAVNHQWSKSSESEQMINDYLHRFITPSISMTSLLRPFSELEIVRRFVQYPQYLPVVTSCNPYFGYARIEQRFMRSPYWCRKCPKCMFLFACYAAFLPKEVVTKTFGGNLYAKRKQLPVIREMLGLKGFKPFDCVGEPEEMIVAMHYAAKGDEYKNTPAMRLFAKEFPAGTDFEAMEKQVFE